MDGFEVIFTCSADSWTGSPEFIHALAAWFELEKFESVSVYREAPSSSELHPDPASEREKLLDVQGPSVEDAIALQPKDSRGTAVMHFGSTPFIDALAKDVVATLPESISQRCTPIEGSLFNGPWKHYDFNSGKLVVESSCCLILGNHLGYPVDLTGYLQAFLEVPSVVQFRQRLKELSGHHWHAVIDLT